MTNINSNPIYWPTAFYNSAEGWEAQKERALKVVKLELRFKRYGSMANRAELMRKASLAAGDSINLCNYCAIENRVQEAQNRVAEELLFEFGEVLPL